MSNEMYDTILVPTDGSDHAVRAAEHGRSLARAFDATVHVLNVVDVQAAAGLFDAGGVDEEFVERLEAEGEAAIEDVEAVVGADGTLRTAVRRGKPGGTILDYAEETDADLLAMGTHGRTGVRRYVAGSVTEHVVRHATAPVLTVRATDRSVVEGDYDDVLVPTDGSDPATAAVDHALAVAEATGARVHALNVVDVGALATDPEYTVPADVVNSLEAQGEKATDAIATRAQEAGLDTVTAVHEGFPASSIVEYADENDVDLVAMGTTGRTGLSRYLLGSTAERVLRHAEMPVLAVNARDE